MESADGAGPRARSGFDRFLNPRAVAVVGASQDLSRIGGQPLKLLTEFGYGGKVYPVNPKYPEIHGLACYPDVKAVPQPCDLALIALSARHVVPAIEQCGEAGIPYAIVLSAGFSEVGSDGVVLQNALRDAARRCNVRVIGPNCLGMINLRDNARVGFGGTIQLRTLIPGPLAMITQSGGFGFGVVASAAYQGLGFNYVVSTGNEADVTTLDLMADFIERDDVEILVVFLEGVQDGRRLVEIGHRALALGKPILAWKVGNSAVGKQAATSHTARMTAGYELYRAAFREGGFIEVRDIDDLVDVAKGFVGRKLPRGNRVGVVTLSGGAGVLIADQCVERGMAVPPLADATRGRLRESVVEFGSINNPVDATAQGYNDKFASYNRTIRAVLDDPGIDAVIARAPRGTATPVWAEGLLAMWRETDKPLVLNWATSPDDNAETLRMFDANGVPCLIAPGRAVRTLSALVEFAAKKRQYDAHPPRAPQRPGPRPRVELPASGTLAEYAGKRVLDRYGIPVVKEALLAPDAVDALLDSPVAFPVAVKIESPDIPHKTEAGVVKLGVASLDELKRTARDLVAAARRYSAQARIDGVIVQEMASGTEAIVGVVNDPWFGPVVAFGLGGIFTELLHEVVHAFAPFDAATARELVLRTKAAPLFAGYRGRPPLDLDALCDTLVRVSWLAADHADRIAEIDINPLFVREAGKGVVAADALIVMKS